MQTYYGTYPLHPNISIHIRLTVKLFRASLAVDHFFNLVNLSCDSEVICEEKFRRIMSI